MNLLPLLAVVEAAQPSDNYFATVVVALAMLGGACYLTGVLTKRSVLATLATMGAPGPTTAPAARSATQPQPAQATPPEIVAVIAAAVDTVMGANYKIVAINPRDSNWGQAGRQSVLSSHKIR